MHTFCFPQYCCCLVVAEIMACARDPNSRDRDRDRDVGQVGRDETSRSRDRLETETSRPKPHPCALLYRLVYLKTRALIKLFQVEKLVSGDKSGVLNHIWF
jgi:hypothetical protein